MDKCQTRLECLRLASGGKATVEEPTETIIKRAEEFSKFVFETGDDDKKGGGE